MHNYIIEKDRFSAGKNASIIRVVDLEQAVFQEMGKSPKFGGEKLVPGAVCSTLLKRIRFRQIFGAIFSVVATLPFCNVHSYSLVSIRPLTTQDHVTVSRYLRSMEQER